MIHSVQQPRRLRSVEHGGEDRDEIVPVDPVGHAPMGDGRARADPLDQGRAPGTIDPRGAHDDQVREELGGELLRGEQHVGGGALGGRRGGLGDDLAVGATQHARGGHEHHARRGVGWQGPAQTPQGTQVGAFVGGSVAAVGGEGDHHGVGGRKNGVPRVGEVQGDRLDGPGQRVRAAPHAHRAHAGLGEAQPQGGPHVPAAGQEHCCSGISHGPSLSRPRDGARPGRRAPPRSGRGKWRERA